jgi:hypothetical protein
MRISIVIGVVLLIAAIAFVAYVLRPSGSGHDGASRGQE